jgi:FkbM family methyltransferase
MSILEGLSSYYNRIGLRGVLAIFANRLFGAPKEVVAYPPGVQSPVRLRVRTTDISCYEAVLLRGEYAFDLPFSPKLIVDAGANIGMSSIYFANRYPNAKIFAVEAETANFAMLVKNVQAYSSITAIHAALWNRDGHINVGLPDPSTGARGDWAFVTHEGPGVSVRAITMATLMREVGIDRVDLAKIDIEGAEQEVFEDPRWLSGARCVMIELHDRFRPGCAEAVEPAMRDFARTQRGETTCFVSRA